MAAGDQPFAADHTARQAGQDRSQGGPARSLYHVPDGRGGDSTAAVRGNSATDRRPAAEASADMTPAVIAAIGLNRRPLDTRQLPSDRLLAPDRALAGSRKHRVRHPGWPLWIVLSRFRSMFDCTAVFDAWEESSGESRLKNKGRRRRVLGSTEM